MPNIRYMPKWLAFLIPIILSLTLLSTVGCSSDDDDKVVKRPEPSQETGIANITISAGVLEPAFREDVRNYGVSTFYTTPPDFQITVAVKDPKSKLFINGQERNNGQVTSVALNRDGDTTIPIQVMAEDGKNFNVVNLTTKVMPLNTRVIVADSIGGNLLDGAKITICDARTKELLASDINLPISAQGTVFLGLEKDRLYDIYARRDDTAEGCVADFDPSREDTVRIISRRDWVKDLPASAPIITEVSFAPFPASGDFADCDWKSVPPGVNLVKDISSNLYALSVVAMAESNVFMRYGRGAIMVNIDNIPSPRTNGGFDSGYLGSSMGYYRYNNTPVVENGKRYVKTERVWSLRYDMPPAGEHFLDIIVYDWANNCTERKLYLDLGSTASVSDRDFTAYQPYCYAIRSWTVGISENLYSRGPVEGEMTPLAVINDPVGPNGDTVWVYFRFDFRESASNGAIITDFRGYELERAISPDGPFEIVKRGYYTAPYYSYYTDGYDYSPELAGGGTFYYRLRYFNYAGYSRWSPVQAITIMPSFNVTLVSPAHNAQGNTLWPTFRFRSHGALLDGTGSSYGHFTLYVRDKEGYEVLNARFEVDFRTLVNGKPAIRIYWGGQWLDISQKDARDAEGRPITIDVEPFVKIEADGTIVIDTDLANDNFGDQFTMFTLYPGESYEWNIFGDRASAASNWTYNYTDSMYFYKLHPVNYQGDPYNYSYSYASNPDEGSGAINGYFTLTISPSAN